VLNKKKEGDFSLAARISSRRAAADGGLVNEPGLQVYSGNFLEGKQPRDVGKAARSMPSAPLLPGTSHFPDSVNKPGFPSTELKPASGTAARPSTVLSQEVTKK